VRDPSQRTRWSDSAMLCGYGLVQGLIGPAARSGPPGALGPGLPSPSGYSPPGRPHPGPHACGHQGGSDAGDAAIRFPPRYRGVFARETDAGHARDVGRATLSPAAKDILARRLTPDAASRLIGIIERMAAAVADEDPAGPDGHGA
jgi:hypothetical protein